MAEILAIATLGYFGYISALFQTFAKSVFVRSILVHSARLRFSAITALYKSTYLLLHTSGMTETVMSHDTSY